MNNIEVEKDRVKECQKRLNIPSCYQCKDIFNCDIRKEYVDAVYLKLSKGNKSNFDF